MTNLTNRRPDPQDEEEVRICRKHGLEIRQSCPKCMSELRRRGEIERALKDIANPISKEPWK